ncbi:single-stranded-DNA-specific exonuclease RecJ [uncultured Maricaulis sp.]|uniref:single-stranded-DNA-specific exonuclease RecJ n=1 Tax=uncultured Maricaulis sp. TaxID=174710 RepID=UPI0030DD0BC8|tara:strand:+ start:35631 stop:37460 length:1830 start_codon:yes stop_codon:yes gene_type:complete
MAIDADRPTQPEPAALEAAFLGVERSLTGRRWIARAAGEAEIVAIARQQQISDSLARVLAGRGVAPAEAAQFLRPRLKDSFPDPASFQDMDKAAGLVWDALDAGQSISVFADYDVDGATSSAQLRRWMRAVGYEAGLYVPDRVAEGYGPSDAAFDLLRERGADLVITVDCGATSNGPLQHARDIGLDVIVIDHHLMDGELPPTAALVNPNRPDDTSGCGHLAAAGVTFVFLAALNREGRRRGRFEDAPEPDLMQWLDLAALGTICDVVSLTGINRALTAQGLKAMASWHNPGLRQLALVAGIKDDTASTYHAGFLLGPRINAGGRVGRSDLGARLLASDDEAEAGTIAAELDALNTERRAIEAEVMEEALAQIERQGQDRAILVASGEGWHAGVIGVVAGRVKERYGKPVIIIGLDTGVSPVLGKGSGRSVAGVNLGGAISAARQAGLLISGGGHAMAGGLTVNAERIHELVAFLDERLAPELAQATDAMALRLDGLLAAQGVSPELAGSFEAASPFGQGNSEPRFALADLRVSFAQRVGKDHVRFTLVDSGGAALQGISFRSADGPVGEALLAADERRWHVAGRIKLDQWNGRNRAQFQLEDMAAAIR